MTTELRKKYKKFRDDLSPDIRKEKSSQIVKNIKSVWHSFDKYDREYLCFYPLGSEPDLLPLCSFILENNWRLYFPVTEKDGIHFYRVNDLNGFRRGTFNVMEPVDRSIEYSRECGVSFTPGLVFDKQMHRIGYGGGYYDRFYEAHPDICRVGICYLECLADEIPFHEWDRKMNMIITDRKERNK